MQALNPYFHCLIDPSFQRIKRLFVLLFNHDLDRANHQRYFVPDVEIKDFMIDGRYIFHQPIKNKIKSYENILKIAIGQ